MGSPYALHEQEIAEAMAHCSCTLLNRAAERNSAATSLLSEGAPHLCAPNTATCRALAQPALASIMPWTASSMAPQSVNLPAA